MFGQIKIKDGAVTTTRTSYKLENISVVSCVRPFLMPAVMTSVLLTGFGLAFSDLLYHGELLTIGALTCLAMAAGFSVGQLKLLSHDLRGSELSTAVYGFYGHLNTQRLKIFSAMNKVIEEEGQ